MITCDIFCWAGVVDVDVDDEEAVVEVVGVADEEEVDASDVELLVMDWVTRTVEVWIDTTVETCVEVSVEILVSVLVTTLAGGVRRYELPKATRATTTTAAAT